MSNEKCAIGIDLGTTYSCVAVWEHGKVVIIPNELGNRTTPSVVAFTDTERFVGEAAKNQACVNPKNTVFDAKRMIGRYFDDPNIQSDMKYWPFQVISDRGKPNIQVEFKGQLKAFAPEEISAMVLSKLKESAETYLGNPVKDAVITVPAYFNDSQRQATIDAGTIAGLNVLRIINEPTAAAIAYGLDKNLKGRRNVFIFDLGGGTFDVSIVTIHQGSRFQVRATSGNTHLGGGDFDNRLLEFLMKELNKKHNKNLNNIRVLNKIRIRSEQIKRTLSSITEDTINVEIEDQDYSLKITRARFEELCLDLFCNTIDISEKAMKDAGVDEHSIDDIVLVGGSTRIPEVKRLLQKLFSNHSLNQSINPDEAVAYGAAVEAAILTGNKNPIIQDLVLEDVIPLSLGTAIEGEIMSFILMRNTTFPCKVTKPYTTVKDNQTEILFPIFEGERPLVKGNNLLGSFNLSGIPPQPRGMANVDVTFDMDVNGILVASAKCRHSGNSSNITIKNDRGRLTKDEIFRMIREAEMYKKDDDMERDRITARNELEKCIYSMRRSTTTAGGALSENKKRMLIDKSHQAEKWLESNSLANKGMIQHQLKELQDLLASIVM